MKKKILSVTVFLSLFMSAQQITSIENRGSELFINNSFTLKKGEGIQVYLPSGNDFRFVKQKYGGFGIKMLGKVANVVGSGAAAVGLGSGSTSVLQGAGKVMNGAMAVQYGADAIDKIGDLPISDKAKKIAGKKMKVIGWEFTDDGYVLNAELDNKKYLINLQEAAMANEIKL
ncbi:hypothetical protein CMV00_01980 [Elizabethkingia anophelis]|nr:hypothetical protein [Elizabethkingia anophelis]